MQTMWVAESRETHNEGRERGRDQVDREIVEQKVKASI